MVHPLSHPFPPLISLARPEQPGDIFSRHAPLCRCISLRVTILTFPLKRNSVANIICSVLHMVGAK